MATSAARDENNVPTLIAALNTDGATITRVYVNPTTHGLQIDDNTTGSDHGPANAIPDENHARAGNAPWATSSTLLAVSSSDGTTPVVVYVTSSGSLLVDSS